ncbi:MAG: hypothetical protein ACI9Y1_003643, partial [Lentisphaeria bacterium]
MVIIILDLARACFGLVFSMFDRYREASVFTDFDLFSFWCIICIEGNVKLTLSRKEAFSCT